MMILSKYDKSLSEHIIYMQILLSKRKMPSNLIADLPYHGMIAHEKAVPIAAAFMRMIEGKFGLFDAFITNPDIESSVRNEALNKLSNELIKFTKYDMGFKNIFFFSSDDSIMNRSKDHGFKHEADMKIFSMSLNGGMGIWHS